MSFHRFLGSQNSFLTSILLLKICSPPEAAKSHVWEGPWGFPMCKDGLYRFNNHIDARNEFSDPKKLSHGYMTVLAAVSHCYISKLIFSDSFGGLWPPWRDFERLPLLETTWGWQKWIQQLKNPKNDISHMLMFKKIILRAFLRPHLAPTNVGD